MAKRRHLLGGSVCMGELSKIFELLSKGDSHSKISRKMGIARSTIRDYQSRAESRSLDYGELSQLSEAELRAKFELKRKGRKRKEDGNIDQEQLCKELLRKGVTKLILYDEYCAKDPKGALSYASFCNRIREYQKSSKLSMKQEYKAAEKYFVDFSGLKVTIYSSGNHPLFEAEIFVATLGLSNYTYVEAVASQSTEDFIGATVRSLHFLKGVPECLVPDNLKAAVVKAGEQADLNKTYLELANYYGLAVLPARARKPQDKAKVETGVRLIQQQIIARLRDRRFYSLSELNQQISLLVEQFNSRMMKSYGFSRQELFTTIELPELSALPVTPYELCIWKKAKVHPDYHVAIEFCYYSVPYRYRGRVVDVCIKEKIVEIFSEAEQIALHRRVKLEEIENPKLKLKHRFSTQSEHMPPSHLFVKDWTRERALSFAKNIGAQASIFIEHLFARYDYEPQAIRATMGLPSLEKRCGKELFEMAAAISNRKQIYSIKYLRETLKHLSTDNKTSTGIEPIDSHQNIRGNEYYH